MGGKKGRIKEIMVDLKHRDDEALCAQARAAIAECSPAASEYVSVTVTDGTLHLWGVIGAPQELCLPRILARLPSIMRVEDHRREWALSE
jgi:hypothetical protein